MFFFYWLCKTLKRRRANKNKSKAERSWIAERHAALLANASETDEPDERRDTMTTSVPVEEETVGRASRRRNVDRVATVSAGRNDGGAPKTAALTRHDNETADFDRLLVILEKLTNKLDCLEDSFNARMDSIERRVGQLNDDGLSTVPSNSNVKIRVAELETEKRKTEKLLNNLSGNMSACNSRLIDIETDNNYTKYSNRELMEMNDALNKRIENLGAALNIDMTPAANSRHRRTASNYMMQMYGE